MSKAVVKKLIAICVLVICLAISYVLLGMGSTTMAWVGVAVDAVGAAFLYINC